jgi:hypothetical protein
MTVILDPELKELMAQDQTVAVLWQAADAGRTALLAKAADRDLAGFKGPVPIQTQWLIGRYIDGSVLHWLVVIYDQPANPYRFETFINVAAPEQRACVEALAAQQQICLHFFDSRTEYVFTKVITNSAELQDRLGRLIALADVDYIRLGQGWDFDRAKARFQADHPLVPF